MQYRACGSASRRSNATAEPQVWQSPNGLWVVVQPAQRPLEPVDVAALLGRKESGLLTLHRLGPLIRHVVRVGGKIGVHRLPVEFGNPVEEPQRLERPCPLIHEPALDVLELLLGQHSEFVWG